LGPDIVTDIPETSEYNTLSYDQFSPANSLSVERADMDAYKRHSHEDHKIAPYPNL